MKTSSRNPILNAVKALTWIIQARSDEVGVREMAAGLGISPSSAHRLVSELVRAGLLKQNAETDRYSLSLEFLRLAYLTIAHVPIRQVALNHMRRLTDACNETSLLGLYDSMRQEMMFVAMIESSHPLKYSVELNRWIPVYAGASGLAIMAYLSQQEISTIIERTRLGRLTANTITERYRLEAALQRIRERGYASTRGQRIPDAVGLAAPVFGSDGQVIADICLTIPNVRFDENSEPRIAALLKQCADEVTKAIGGRPRNQHASVELSAASPGSTPPIATDHRS